MNAATNAWEVTGTLVERREKVLAIIPHVSGPLSMLGSTIVATHILAQKFKAKKPLKSYNYIMLAMSVVDFISSLAYSFGSVLMPPGLAAKYHRLDRYEAQGNEQTCAAQGFGVQLGITLIFLNLLLSMHYLGVIRFRFREEKLRKYTVPGLIFAIFMGLVFSVPLIFLQGYNYKPLWCWIGPNVPKCTADGLTMKECKERVMMWRDVFYFVPLWLCVGLIAIVHFAIFWTVQGIDAKADKWRFSQAMSKSTSDKKTRETRPKRRLETSRRVAFQSLLYLASFIICWMPFTVAVHILPAKDSFLVNNEDFWLLVLTATLQPLQGFLNCLVYLSKRRLAHG